ncbi:MAG: superoxide dismutase [Calditrichaeota bacterium]|nr:superoxide dismutase [Candidatus Cloacimonadota bacterium]MCB1048180.1 superoxide dismutase [Calditrichota bacterium]MCB9473631.1 superoxide dismutase [Candidatus Delongbacteria bacterium]
MHRLPDLPYDFNALEPSIDARTMEIHHGKHHNAYVTNLNNALEAAGGDLGDKDIISLCANLNLVPEAQRTAVRNNGGGHYNHSLFWSVMCSGGSADVSLELARAIDDFGGMDALREKFAAAAATRFGSGWAWITASGGKIQVSSTPNQDNPLMDNSGTPILGLDVWEHAYYLHYQNRRPDYIKAWWEVVNWAEVSKRFSAAR